MGAHAFGSTCFWERTLLGAHAFRTGFWEYTFLEVQLFGSARFWARTSLGVHTWEPTLLGGHAFRRADYYQGDRKFENRIEIEDAF